MAEISLQEKLKRLDKISDGFNSKKTKVAVGRLINPIIKNKLVPKFIKTPSIRLNKAMGGGFPVGKTTLVAGNEDSGKTFLLLETIGNRMKIDPNFVVGWLESENSLIEDAISLFNIDPARFLFIEPTEEGGAEEALDIAYSVIAGGTCDMFVVNSLKCLVPKTELDKDMGEQQVGLQARMNSKMMRKLTAVISENEVALILIQHLTTSIGTMSRDPLIVAGGKTIRFGAALILDMRKRSIQASDPIQKEIGVKVGVTITKNHVVIDKFPYVKLDYYGIFGEGTEVYLELLELALEEGLLAKAGAFIKVPDEEGNAKILEDGTKLQWQGNIKFREYCIENPEFFADLESKLNNIHLEMLGEEEAAKLDELNNGSLDELDKEVENLIAKKTSKNKKKAKKEEKIKEQVADEVSETFSEVSATSTDDKTIK